MTEASTTGSLPWQSGLLLDANQTPRATCLAFAFDADNSVKQLFNQIIAALGWQWQAETLDFTDKNTAYSHLPVLLFASLSGPTLGLASELEVVPLPSLAEMLQDCSLKRIVWQQLCTALR